MQRFLSLLLALLAFCSVNALAQSLQLSLGPQRPGVWRLDFINDVVLINPGAPLNARLDYEILSGDGTGIASAVVPGIVVGTGTGSLRSMAHGKPEFSFGGSQASSHLQATELLPPGRYVFNARLYDAATGALLATASMENPLYTLQTPLRLAFPGDGDTIPTTQPVLQWIPPQPSVEGLRYSVLLFETTAKGRRAKPKAVPLKKIGPVAQQQFLYVGQTPALAYNVTYAWKVVALADDYVVDESDVWTFTPARRDGPTDKSLRSDSATLDSLYTHLPYWVLDDRLDEGYYDVFGACKLAFINNSADTSLNYGIANLSQPQDSVGALPHVPLQHGWNYLTIDLTGASGMLPEDYYLLQIRLGDVTEYRVRFKYYQD